MGHGHIGWFGPRGSSERQPKITAVAVASPIHLLPLPIQGLKFARDVDAMKATFSRIRLSPSSQMASAVVLIRGLKLNVQKRTVSEGTSEAIERV